VAVVWTGGSTGIPKGALFDHRNLEAVAAGTDVLSSPRDRRLSPLPFAHVGYMTRPWDEISSRIATVITPTPWRAGDAIRLIERESVTVGQGVPTQWALVLAHPDIDSADLSSLRVAGTGASRVPPELVRAMRERLGCPVVVRYTSTETSLGTGTRPGDPDEVVATTFGAPVSGVELELSGPSGPWRTALAVSRDATGTIAQGTLQIPEVACWWPHTHGQPALYEVLLRVETSTGNRVPASGPLPTIRSARGVWPTAVTEATGPSN